MGRRRQSPLEDVVEIAIALPWWGNLIAALATYIIGVVIIPAMFMARNSAKSFFSVGHFFAPFIKLVFGFLTLVFLVAAIIKYVTGVLKKGFPNTNISSDSVRDMDWREFEILVGEVYKRQGYAVQQKGGDMPDGGVDLVLSRNGEKILVQCKHWRVYRVNVKIVREIYGVMVDEAASGAIVITSGDFTQDALDFVKDKPVTLINGSMLAKMISKGDMQAATVPFPEAVSPQSEPKATVPKPKCSEKDFMPQEMRGEQSGEPPVCPGCKIPMVLRTAKHGPNPGSKFWGCLNYPNCRHTRPFNKRLI